MLYPTAIYPLFLVGLLVAYWRIPARWRRHVLWAGSLALLGFLSWRATAAFLALAGFIYLVGRRLREQPIRRSLRTTLLSIGIAAPVAYLCTFKYLPEYSPPIHAVLQLLASGDLLLPLGISYFTFKFLHYIIEARRGTLPPHDWWDFLTYASLFSIFAAGPIERFHGLQPQLASPRFSSDDFVEGLQRIFFGLVKKILLADLLLVLILDEVEVARESPPTAALHAQFAYLWGRFLYIYFDFSAYSDIAIGTSRLFGLRIMENFDWPLLRKNLSEFWRAWHISLSSWCRDYVYFPVLGSTRNPKVAVYASMLVLGYWHGANPIWICWGAWHASGLAVWQLWQTFKRRHPALQRLARESVAYRIAAAALTLNFVAIGAVWPSSATVREGWQFLYYMVIG